ncbi:DUF2946 domain-containing protein [Pseudomonas sp. PS01302]|uniref:DUF2946 domain-containing protein n=1 Tax=Pseudomonas sp. PS01302 TaxID=2991438 RepID=UPI0032B337C7
MTVFRTFRSPIAWILFAVVLFNGLACSIGHGQMMGAFNSKGEASASHAGHDMSQMHGAHHQMHMHTEASSKKIDMSGSMTGQSGDCSFAGTLTQAIIFFVALSWLLRGRSPRSALPDIWQCRLSRHSFPRLNPQAP